MHDYLQRFDYLWRSSGLTAAVTQALRYGVRPIYYRDQFIVSIRHLSHDTREPVESASNIEVRGRVVSSRAQMASLESSMHPYIVQQELTAYLEQNDRRYVILAELTDLDAPLPVIGFRKMERGRFMIYDYDFGGDLPPDFAMNQDSGIAPEYRGRRYHHATRSVGHNYAERIGVSYTVSVIRTHNEASLKQGMRPVRGTRRELFGPFEIREWLGRYRSASHDWSALRAMLLQSTRLPRDSQPTA